MDSLMLAKMQERFGHGLRATYEMITDLEKARAAFETLVDDMADVCLLMTSSGTCIWGNQAAADLLGIDPEEIPPRRSSPGAQARGLADHVRPAAHGARLRG